MASKVIRFINIGRIFRTIIVVLFFLGLLFDFKNYPFLASIKKYVYPFLEVSLITLLIIRIVQAIKHKASGAITKDFLDRARSLLSFIFDSKSIGYAIASEVSIIYYLLLLRKPPVPDNITSFSSYKESGTLALQYSILSILLIETVGMHFLYMRINMTLAYILTGLSAYTCFQLLAHIRAIKFRLIRLNQKELEFHMGLATDVDVSYAKISSISINKDFTPDKETAKFGFLSKMENSNVLIELKEKMEVIKILGVRKQAKRLYLYVDHSDNFISSVKNKLIDS